MAHSGAAKTDSPHLSSIWKVIQWKSTTSQTHPDECMQRCCFSYKLEHLCTSETLQKDLVYINIYCQIVLSEGSLWYGNLSVNQKDLTSAQSTEQNHLMGSPVIQNFCNNWVFLSFSCHVQILKLCPKKKSSAAYTFCKAMGLLGMQFHLFENECKSQCSRQFIRKQPQTSKL